MPSTILHLFPPSPTPFTVLHLFPLISPYSTLHSTLFPSPSTILHSLHHILPSTYTTNLITTQYDLTLHNSPHIYIILHFYHSTLPLFSTLFPCFSTLSTFHYSLPFPPSPPSPSPAHYVHNSPLLLSLPTTSTINFVHYSLLHPLPPLAFSFSTSFTILHHSLFFPLFPTILHSFPSLLIPPFYS